MIEIEFEVEEARALLDEVANRLTDMRPVMETIGEILVDSTKQRFLAGRSPQGAAWAPKSLTTIEAQRRGEGRGRNGRPVDTRPLFGPSGRLHTEIHHQARADGVSWGSNLIYAAVQQFGAAKGQFGTMANGAPIPWGDIPARPYIGVSIEDQAAIIAALEDFLAAD